jgi:hypothetical protein
MATTNPSQTGENPANIAAKTTNVAWFVGPAFALLAAVFLMLPQHADVPPSGTPDFDPKALEPTIRQTVNHDPPITTVGTYEYRCNDCHNLFQNSAEKIEGLVQHLNIRFNHGMNNRCFNCHDQLDRNKLVARDGSYISYTDIPSLCSQCHGTTYRDWQRGTHGKTLGSWQTGSPNQRRLECSECHDPHAPAFPDYEPLPAPNTLRMGEQHAGIEHHSESPLALPFQSNHSDADPHDTDTQHQDPAPDHTDEGGDGS